MILKKRNLILTAVILCFILAGFSGPVFAQFPGFSTYLGDAPGAAQSTVTNLLTLLNKLACYFIRFGIIAVGVMIMIYGIMFLASRGNPQSVGNAKKALGWGIVGGMVVFGVFTIILTVSSLAGYGDASYTGYPILNIVNCI